MIHVGYFKDHAPGMDRGEKGRKKRGEAEGAGDFQSDTHPAETDQSGWALIG
jgi:hypothetical protein